MNWRPPHTCCDMHVPIDFMHTHNNNKFLKLKIAASSPGIVDTIVGIIYLAQHQAQVSTGVHLWCELRELFQMC